MPISPFENESIDGSPFIAKKSISSANTSTEIKSKDGADNRRKSLRAKAKPTFFDASPVVSSSKSSTTATPIISPGIGETSENDNTIVDTQEVEDQGNIFKKPPPVSRKKSTSKNTLNVTIKKVKGSNKAKYTVASNDSSLFDIVKDGKSAMMSVINDWIESYSRDKMSAMTELIQFFVSCSGCNAQVTTSMIEAEDTVRAIRHLTENFGEQAEEYPLVINRPEFKKFKSNFVGFILQLINLSQHSIIYDGDMMDILICWITGLSDSQVRAFRHTSSLAAMKIVSGIIEVALKVGVEMDHTQRQLDAENLKTANKKSREKVEKLKSKREELRQNKSELEEMMNRIFSSIFIHRYRDARPEIRAICFVEMGHWMNSYSTYFLNQNYLRYFGWTLYDKVGDVRLQVLNALEELYKNKEFLEKLELFTERFKERLINMTLDVNNDVAVKAINLACLLYKYDALKEDDCSQVEQLVFCDQRGMAHAAGEFLALRIIRLSLEASPKKLKKGNKEEYLRQMNLKAILEFFRKTEIHEHCTYIVDSLWEHTELLKDWRTMTNLLLDQNSLIDLDNDEESALIDLMTCAVKQAAGGVAPPGRALAKKQSIKEKKTLEEDRNNISIHYMEFLPDLLQKYKADVSKVKELLTIPQYFKLELYAEKRLTNNLETLLSHMEDIVLKHADKELLDTCSLTYHYLKDNELGIHQTVDISLNKLLDGVVEKFRKSIIHGIPSEGKSKSRVTQAYFNVSTGLKRILSFYRHHDLTDWQLYDDIHTINEQGVKASVEDELLSLSLHTMFQVLLQELSSLDPENPDKGDLKKLRKRAKAFVKQLDDLLQFSSIGIKIEVFKILCDFFMFFPKQTLNDNPQFESIILPPEHGLQIRMRDFVITHIFNAISEDDDDDNLDEENDEDEAKINELNEKRLILTGLCRLMAFEIFDFKLAAPIYAQLIRAYADYSDIIKHLMSKAKDNNIITFSKVLLFALQQVFENIREDSNGKIDVKSKEFLAVKDLAKRFSLQIGININLDHIRKSTIIIHREGQKYALQHHSDNTIDDQVVPDVPPNILFLEVLHEFVYRVIKQDRKVVLRDLNSVAGDMLEKKGVEWAPLRNYLKEMEKLADVEETKITDEADKELEEELALEKNQKRGQQKEPKKKVQKKLSLSKVPGTDKWVNKADTGDNEEAPPSKVARGIPKVRKSSDYPEQEEKSKEDSDDEGENTISKTPVNRRSKTSAKNTPGTAKTKSGQRGSVAKNPVKLTVSEQGDSEDDDERSDANSTITDAMNESVELMSQKTWLTSQQQTRGSAKKPKQSYEKSENKRKNLDESNQDSSSDISTPSSSARELRAAKRRKQDEDED